MKTAGVGAVKWSVNAIYCDNDWLSVETVACWHRHAVNHRRTIQSESCTALVRRDRRCNRRLLA